MVDPSCSPKPAPRGACEVRGTLAGGSVRYACREVRGARAPGACRIRVGAHRLRPGTPLSGLDLPCFLWALPREPAGRIETARARRRSRRARPTYLPHDCTSSPPARMPARRRPRRACLHAVAPGVRSLRTARTSSLPRALPRLRAPPYAATRQPVLPSQHGPNEHTEGGAGNPRPGGRRPLGADGGEHARDAAARAHRRPPGARAPGVDCPAPTRRHGRQQHRPALEREAPLHRRRPRRVPRRARTPEGRTGDQPVPLEARPSRAPRGRGGRQPGDRREGLPRRSRPLRRERHPRAVGV